MTNQLWNVIYVGSIFLSSVLFAPVATLLCARLYRSRPGAALASGVLLAFALLLETVATLLSLSLLSLTPDAAGGDPVALRLFQTVHLQYLAVDFPGVVLFYVAALVLGIALLRLHRPSAWLLLGSTAILFGGFVLPGDWSLRSNALSIAVYGVAYVSLGRAAARIGKENNASRPAA